MGDRTKRIFISDIHMGDARSMSEPNPYVWFNSNIPLLAQFLAEQLSAPDVKEVVILGDLFDQWVIPVNDSPLTTFDSICANDVNKPVIDMLRALVASPVKLAYVPGNHDMAMNVVGISAARQFMEAIFPDIRYLCDNSVPLGLYSVGALAAEHGDRYCLFNAPDTWTAQDAFLPLGYFISRMLACKVKETGHDEDYHDIFVNLLKKHNTPETDFLEDLFSAIAEDAGLTPDTPIDLGGIPGYSSTMTVGEIGIRFRHLFHNWREAPGHDHISRADAIAGDLDSLWGAAALTYFRMGSHFKIVIFGHTHVPALATLYDPAHLSSNVTITPHTPWRAIYANCGTWVDGAKQGCTYVETEEDLKKRHHYVRVREYPGNEIYNGMEAYIRM